jgi:hypothetical protein
MKPVSARRLLGVTATAAIAFAVISVGASALAAPAGPPSNNRAAAPPAAAAGRPAAAAAGTVTHHLSLAASAFVPDGLHNAADDYFNEWDPTTLSNTESGRCFNTGLQLPPSITLKSVKVYYTAGSAAMYFEINRQDLVHHTALELVDFDTTIASTPAYESTTEAIPAADATVNMTDYAYSVGVCPSGSTTFSGLTLTYTQPAG